MSECGICQSGRAKRETAKGETGPGTHIFADFCRFSLIFGSLCKSRDLGVADLRRKPQETADFRRKPQKTADFCRNRFLPFAVSLLARSYMRARPLSPGAKTQYHRNRENYRPTYFLWRIIWRSVMGYRTEKIVSGNIWAGNGN